MNDEEKKVQRALGLEQAYIIRIHVKVPMHVTVPFIAQGISPQETRERLTNLSNEDKKKIVQYSCAQVCKSPHNFLGEAWGDIAINIIEHTEHVSDQKLKDVDPKALGDTAEISTDEIVDGLDDAKEYMVEELGFDEGDILVI